LFHRANPDARVVRQPGHDKLIATQAESTVTVSGWTANREISPPQAPPEAENFSGF